MFPYINNDDVFLEDNYDRGNSWISLSMDSKIQKEVISGIDKIAQSAGAVLSEKTNSTAFEYKLKYVIPARSLESFYFHVPVGYIIYDRGDIPLFVKIRISSHEETDEIFIGTEDGGEYISRTIAAISYENENMSILTGSGMLTVDGSLEEISHIQEIENSSLEDVFLSGVQNIEPDIFEDCFYVDESILYRSDFWKSPEVYADDIFDQIEEAEVKFMALKDEVLSQLNDMEYDLKKSMEEIVSRANDASDFLDDVLKNIKKDIKEFVKDKDLVLSHNEIDPKDYNIQDIVIDYK